MPKPRGKVNKKALSVSEAVKGSELNDAVVLGANGFNEELGETISKPDTLVENDVAKEEEAPIKASNGRGGRGKKADIKVVKDEVPAKKAAAAAPKNRGRGKKLDDVEVIAKEVEENAQSNGVASTSALASASASVEEPQEEEDVTKGKASGGKGKRGAKAAAAAGKEIEVLDGETKENGDAEAETEKPEVVTKTSKGRGGKKAAAKDMVEDLKETQLDENPTKTQEPETKVPAKKNAGRKKKADDKAPTEAAIENDTSGKSTFDLLKEEDEARIKQMDDNPSKATSEDETTKAAEEPVEIKAAAKKPSGRKKKADDKASTESVVEKETNGKSLFDLLKEETEAAKTNKDDEKPKEIALEEVSPEPETKPVAKKTGGRKKKADSKSATETVAQIETNGKTTEDIVAPNDEDEEPPKKKGRAGRKPAAVINKAEVETTNTIAEDAVAMEMPEVDKKTSKRGGLKAQETPKEEEVVEIEKKPTKRGRGAVAKTAIAVDAADIVATEEALPKKRSRKEPSVEKELKPEIEKPKRGRAAAAAAGKRKTDKLEEEVKEQIPQEEPSSAPAEATEDASTKKSIKAAATSTTTTTSRGGRKRAAPSTNKSKTDADEDIIDRNAAAAAEKVATIEADDDEADGSKSSKAKKKKKESPVASTNASITEYKKEDFQLAPLADGQTAEEPRYNLKISSWNVAGLRAWLKKEGLKFLDYEEPDIFCLQETKCTTDQLPEEVTPIPGYHPYWLCMPGGYAGVAIYSKIMPINVEYGIGHKDFDDVGRVITAEYEKFFLINVYVPNSGRKLVNLEARMKWEKLFQEFVQKFNDRKPVILCGDMNVSHQEIDLANPKSNTRSAGFTKEERDKMTELLALGYVDTFRHLYPERKAAYTYWTYMSNARARNVGWRLDYFIVSERFTKRIVDNCIRSQCLGSDHCPITLFLKL